VGAAVVTELFIAGMEPVESCTPGVAYGPDGLPRPDSLAVDSSGAPFDAPAGGPAGGFGGDPAPAGRRATVPFGDTLVEPPAARRRRPAGPARDTLFEQTAPPGYRPSEPAPR
jgi:hypothetical protein